MFFNSKEFFFNFFSNKIHDTKEKKINRTIVRRLPYIFLILIGFFITIKPLQADIEFKGICGSYSYDIQINSNNYYGAICVDEKLQVYQDANTDRVRYLFPLLDFSIFAVHDHNNRVTRFFGINPNDVKYIGENGGLTYVLAGSFIGFTILFFSSFIFIEVAKK